jgi:hypothetical protein
MEVSNIHAISTERGLQLISQATKAGRASGGKRESRERMSNQKKER